MDIESMKGRVEGIKRKVQDVKKKKAMQNLTQRDTGGKSGGFWDLSHTLKKKKNKNGALQNSKSLYTLSRGYQEKLECTNDTFQHMQSIH